MPGTFEQLIAAAHQAGRKTHAGWNSELFTQAANGPAQFLWKQTDGDVVAGENYLRLLAEGIGRGYFTQSIHPQHAQFFAQHCRWRCLLEYWLNLTLPLEVAKIPPARRVEVFARVWNLGENIVRDQPWIDPYLLKKVVASPPALADLERELNAWMGPLLQPARRATWSPPFDVQVVDGRDVHPDFLPGEMRLGAAAVVCVRDRRLDGVFGGVFLHELTCEVIAPHRDFGTSPANRPSASVEFQPGRAIINGHAVALPFVNWVHSHLVCDRGAVLVSTVDSQRLWVIRCQ
jgi:hypothetical protein